MLPIGSTMAEFWIKSRRTCGWVCQRFSCHGNYAVMDLFYWACVKGCCDNYGCCRVVVREWFLVRCIQWYFDKSVNFNLCCLTPKVIRKLACGTCFLIIWFSKRICHIATSCWQIKCKDLTPKKLSVNLSIIRMLCRVSCRYSVLFGRNSVLKFSFSFKFVISQTGPKSFRSNSRRKILT